MIRPHCTLSLLTAACLYGLLAVSCSPTVDYGYAPQTLRALNELDEAMLRGGEYDAGRQRRIASLRRNLAAARSDEERVRALLDLQQVFVTYELDSAARFVDSLYAFARSRESHNFERIAALAETDVLMGRGLTDQAETLFRQIDTAGMTTLEYRNWYARYNAIVWRRQAEATDPGEHRAWLDSLRRIRHIRIGAAVKPDDILVGKITPKGETQLTPEEKLLRAIFGEKARDVKNTSLKVPPGVEGTVIDVKVFNRRSGEKDDRTLAIEAHDTAVLDQKESDHMRALGNRTREVLAPHVLGKLTAVSVPGNKKGEVLVEAGVALTREQLDAIPVKKLQGLFESKEVNDIVADQLKDYDHQVDYLHAIYDSKREKVTEGDDLPPGVIKMVKVHIAIKRKLSVGDKMAGRHGNKGVVSCILPEEDMPFFADGRPVDIVLNPLGVPSRMNIGQIMETHLGWGAKELGRQLAELLDSGAALQVVRDEVKDVFDSPAISELVDKMDDEEFIASVKKLRNGIVTKTPVFDGATEEEIWGWMEKAGKDSDGKTILYDGRTGVPFKNRVTTGVMYILKLHHLVDEKIPLHRPLQPGHPAAAGR